jgi:peptidoglycan/LPS O-acetylase OafA/YrhL
MQRSSLIGVGLVCLLASGMLSWPLFGNPPYGFYAPMKWVVAFASGVGAWTMWNVSKALLPLSVLLVASGGVELFGKMRREQWVPFNWASLVLLVLAGVIALAAAARAPKGDGENA